MLDFGDVAPENLNQKITMDPGFNAPSVKKDRGVIAKSARRANANEKKTTSKKSSWIV